MKKLNLHNPRHTKCRTKKRLKKSSQPSGLLNTGQLSKRTPSRLDKTGAQITTTIFGKIIWLLKWVVGVIAAGFISKFSLDKYEDFKNSDNQENLNNETKEPNTLAPLNDKKDKLMVFTICQSVGLPNSCTYPHCNCTLL